MQTYITRKPDRDSLDQTKSKDQQLNHKPILYIHIVNYKTAKLAFHTRGQ